MISLDSAWKAGVITVRSGRCVPPVSKVRVSRRSRVKKERLTRMVCKENISRIEFAFPVFMLPLDRKLHTSKMNWDIWQKVVVSELIPCIWDRAYEVHLQLAFRPERRWHMKNRVVL
jgi:hypothetical protein